MKTQISAFAGLLAMGGAIAAFNGQASAAGGVQLNGVACETPAPIHCPDKDCPASITNAPGNATDTATGRKFFLDYPCDLKPGQKVIVVLALHGGGSIGNWQRHYFPIMDFKDKYRLVIITPTAAAGGTWNAGADDAHLHNVTTQVYDELAKNNIKIKAFWLAGHSFGGQTSNRLINTDQFFRTKVTGWVSLSGGRLGSRRDEVRAAIPTGSGGAAPAAGRGGPPPAARGGPPAPGALAADASVLPDFKFSFIYATGEHELTPAGLPTESKWAANLGCGAQARPRDVVDTKAGYVYDSREQANPNAVWGFKPKPGTSKFYDYPRCPGGRVVADIVRGDKGHTEGYEPHLTEDIVKMMVKASG